MDSVEDMEDMEDIEFIEFEQYNYQGVCYIAPYNWSDYVH